MAANSAANNPYEQTTSEFAPDLDEIIDDLNQIDSPIDLLTAILNTDWDGLIKLYSEPQLAADVRSQKIADLNNYINGAGANYNTLIAGKRSAALLSLTQKFKDDVLGFLINWLFESCNITYKKLKDAKDSVLDGLKGHLNAWYESHSGSSYLYNMEIIDNPDLLTINLKYTELGFLIMLQTEIRHDLAHLPQTTLAYIDSKIQAGVTDRDLKNMFFNVKEQRVSYTEEIATELCLHLLNLKQSPRVIQKHGQTELQLGAKEVGHGIFPDVYANSDFVCVTSDSSNVANVEYSQLRAEQLKNNNGTNYPFLNLDAGSAPTMIGYKEHMERTEQLMELESGTKPQPTENAKPVVINVFHPTDSQMVRIESVDMKSYNITIYPDLGSALKTQIYSSVASSGKKQRVSGAALPSGPVTIPNISNLSITTITDIVTKQIQQPNYYFNASILKSLGDLVPYVTVCLQDTLKYGQGTTNVVSSIDYSMIFQTLGYITFKQNGVDVTPRINAGKILVGVNLGNSNVYFPWSKREKGIYQFLSVVNFMRIDAYTALRKEMENLFLTLSYELYGSKIPLTPIFSEYLKHKCMLNMTECVEYVTLFTEKNPEAAGAINNYIAGLNSVGEKIAQLNTIITGILDRNNGGMTPGVIGIDKLDYDIMSMIVDARQAVVEQVDPRQNLKRERTLGGRTKSSTNKRRTKRKYGKKR